MAFKQRYSLLLIPENGGATRPVTLRRRWFVLAAVLVLLVGGVAGLYAVDWVTGTAWRPGGSPVARENLRLRQHLDRVEVKVAGLETELASVWEYQTRVATAADLPAPDGETRLAGIGGRGPLELGGGDDVELAGPGGGEIDRLLRQARIQRQGFATMLDTLAARSDVRDRLPSIRPCDIGWLSSRYGMRQDPYTGKQAFHRGIDFSLPVGTEVRVTAAGKVAKVEKQRGLGLLVKVDHGGGITTVYAHLHEVLVERGQTVRRGEVIAKSGNTGRSTGPHLHYEVHVRGRSVNPIGYILDSYASRS